MGKLTRQFQKKISRDFEVASRHYHNGALPKAEKFCRKVLAVDPDHADAWHMLALIALAVGKNDAALDLASKAISYQPQNPAMLNTLGVICLHLGRLEEAAGHLRQTLDIQDSYPEAHNNLGTVLQAQGEMGAAERSYRQALALRPGFADALINLAGLYQSLGQWEARVSCYQQVLKSHPSHSKVRFDLGVALSERDLLKEAEQQYRSALAVQPDFAEAHLNLGSLLHKKGAFDQALFHYKRALAVKADYPEAYHDLGSLLQDFGRFEEAIDCYRQAIALQPDFPAPHNNLGGIYLIQGNLEEAAACYRQALTLRPDLAEACNNLGGVLEAQGLTKEAQAHYRRALSLQPDYPGANDNLLLSLQYDADVEAAEIEAAHRDWGRRVAARIPPEEVRWSNDPDPDRRLRIGFVSADFREHSVAYFLRDVFEALDPGQAAVFCYANNVIKDEMTGRLKRVAAGWRDIVGLNDGEAARLIRKDEIDILVDLAGHTGNNRLLVFALRAAPVQVTWLGYPDTTGLATMDYRITDAIADPPGDSGWHSEELIRLADGFLCYGESSAAPDPAGPPCVDHRVITFGCFNNNAKINPRLIALWAEILSQVPGSRLLLKNNALRSPAVRELWQKRFQEHDVSLERLELVPRVASYTEHLETYNRMDVALDVFPYNGTTTTCEAMWMGVPVVVLRGERHVGRVGASLLTRVGLEELIAETPEEYVAKAVALANDKERLAGWRHDLRERMHGSALGDAGRFAKTLEQTFRDMWRKWLGATEN